MIVENYIRNEISNDLTFYEWSYHDVFKSQYTFAKFLNWLSAEFTLYLQDDSNGLTIYFPNGQFSVIEIDSTIDHTKFKFKLKSKCLKSGTRILNLFASTLKHLKLSHE